MDVSCAILDNLMGRDRNKTANEIKMKDHYSNKDVCKPFLICFCFHTLFPNTAYDDGVCRFKHDTFIKNMFDQDTGRTQYEKKYLVQCIDWIQRRLVQVEVRIKKNKEMIDIKSNNPSERPKQIIDRLMEVDVQIDQTVRQAQAYAQNGQIYDSQRCMNDVQRLREKKKQIELMGDSLTSTTLKQQKICEVCGAIQVINDTEKRIAMHLEGKIHQGFLKLRHQIQTLKIRLSILNSQQPNNDQREKAIQKNQNETKRRSKSREAEKQKQRAREKQRQKEKVEKQKQRQRQKQKQRNYDDKYKAQKKNDRDKDRQRQKDRHRDKSRQFQKQRTQKHRERSKDRKDKDRHRQKQRSRERKQKKRDRSRQKDKRDRSDSHHKRKHRKDS